MQSEVSNLSAITLADSTPFPGQLKPVISLPRIDFLRRFTIIHFFQMLLIIDGLMAGVPQIAKIITNHSSADISIATWSWMFFMAIVWAFQGYRDKSKVTMYGSIVWAIADASIIGISLFYRF